MALPYKTRRKLSLLILLIALPLYIVVAVNLTDWLRARFEIGFLTELLVFVVLGIIWIVPLKSVFLGVGQADPEAREDK